MTIYAVIDDGDKKQFNLLSQLLEYEKYHNIVELYCYNEELYHLPTILPKSLRKLDCNNNCIVTLPELPDSLEVLNCSVNKIKCLPIKLPSNLKILNCSRNYLVMLPKDLPETIMEIDCSNNILTEIPKYFPPTMKGVFNCSNNFIETIPNDLDCSFYNLNISYNRLYEIPIKLPESIKELNCSYNRITGYLRYIPSNILIFECYHNKITRIPNNLGNVRYFDCSDNMIRKLPYNMSDVLEYLDCSKNRIYHLEHEIPKTVTSFISDTNIYKPNLAGYYIKYKILGNIRNSIKKSISDSDNMVCNDEITTFNYSSNIYNDTLINPFIPKNYNKNLGLFHKDNTYYLKMRIIHYIDIVTGIFK